MKFKIGSKVKKKNGMPFSVSMSLEFGQVYNDSFNEAIVFGQIEDRVYVVKNIKQMGSVTNINHWVFESELMEA